MFAKSVFSPIAIVSRANIRTMHATALLFKYPVGKTGKLLTPYIKFTVEKRPELIANNPELTVPETGRKLGELWRQLSETERQKYFDEYTKAKAATK